MVKIEGLKLAPGQEEALLRGKAARLLHWHAEKDLADMCRDAWRWQQSQNQ